MVLDPSLDAMLQPVRLLVGARLRVEAANQVLALVERAGRLVESRKAAWVSPVAYRLPFAYVGWSHSHAWQAIAATLEPLLAAVASPLELGVKGLVAMPHQNAAQALALAFDDPSGQLTELAQRVRTTLADLGFTLLAAPSPLVMPVASFDTAQDLGDLALDTVADQKFSQIVVSDVDLLDSAQAGRVLAQFAIGGQERASVIAVRQTPELLKQQLDTRTDGPKFDNTDDGWPRGYSA